MRSCKLAGRGRKARLRCTLRGFGAVRRVSVTVKKGRRTVAKKTVRPSAAGVLSFKPSRRLRRGTYKVTLVLRDAAGGTALGHEDAARALTRRLQSVRGRADKRCMLAATAYEAGRIAGQATRPAPASPPSSTASCSSAGSRRGSRRPSAWPSPAPASIAIVVFSVAGGSARGDEADSAQKLDPNRAHAEMVAGCVNTGGEQHAATASASPTG